MSIPPKWHRCPALIPARRELGCLRHLRELKADGNNITTIDGLERLDGLVKLSLQSNSIHFVDFGHCRWFVVQSFLIELTKIHGHFAGPG